MVNSRKIHLIFCLPGISCSNLGLLVSVHGVFEQVLLADGKYMQKLMEVHATNKLDLYIKILLFL